jgi:hypothetical protein
MFNRAQLARTYQVKRGQSQALIGLRQVKDLSVKNNIKVWPLLDVNKVNEAQTSQQ